MEARRHRPWPMLVRCSRGLDDDAPDGHGPQRVGTLALQRDDMSDLEQVADLTVGRCASREWPVLRRDRASMHASLFHSANDWAFSRAGFVASAATPG